MKIAALFPGYGSQFVGMGKELYDESRLVQEYFELAASCVDINFVKLCFASSDVELSKIGNAYMALFLVSSSLFDLITQEGIEVDTVAGYNVGQLAAMHASGSLSLPDGLYFLNKFIPLYQELLTKKKFVFARVFGVESKQLQKLCKKVSTKESSVNVSVFTDEKEQIIAGDPQAVVQVLELATDLEGLTETIGSEEGLHSPAMKSVVEAVTPYFEKIDFKDARVPLVCNFDADEIKTGIAMQSCLINWMAHPVNWTHVIDSLADYDLLLEIGPGTQLRDKLQSRYPDKKIISINVRADIERVKEMLKIGSGSQEK